MNVIPSPCCPRILFASEVFRSVLSFAWRVPRDFRKMDRKLVSSKVVRILGHLLAGLSVWGAVLTLRDLNDHFPDGGNNCSRAVYLSGLLSSFSTLIIALVIIIVVLTHLFKVKCLDTGKTHRDIRFFYESYYSSSSDDSSGSSESDEEEARPSF